MSGGLDHLILSGPVLLAMPVAAAAGAITFLSPCCLPLVPGYLSYLTGMSGSAAPGPDPAAEAALVLSPAIATAGEAAAAAPRPRTGNEGARPGRYAQSGAGAQSGDARHTAVRPRLLSPFRCRRSQRRQPGRHPAPPRGRPDPDARRAHHRARAAVHRPVRQVQLRRAHHQTGRSATGRAGRRALPGRAVRARLDAVHRADACRRSRARHHERDRGTRRPARVRLRARDRRAVPDRGVRIPARRQRLRLRPAARPARSPGSAASC